MDLWRTIRTGFKKAPPPLQPGEEVLWQRRAGRVFRRTLQGGVLYLTDRRLLFVPNVYDAERGANVSDLPRARIASVGAEPRTFHPIRGFLQGGIRQRLRVEEPNGWFRLYRVAKLDETIDELRAHGLG